MYYYPLLQVRKLRAQQGEVISPGSHSLAVAEALVLWSFDLKFYAFFLDLTAF